MSISSEVHRLNSQYTIHYKKIFNGKVITVTLENRNIKQKQATASTKACKNIHQIYAPNFYDGTCTTSVQFTYL